MKTIVPDASVIVKWYIPERDHEQAKSLRDRYINGDIKLAAPDLLPYEVINALRYTEHLDRASLMDASTSIVDFGIDLIPFSRIGPAARLADQLDVTIYDAAYLALSFSRDLTLYTSDETLLDAVRHADEPGDGDVLHIHNFE